MPGGSRFLARFGARQPEGEDLESLLGLFGLFVLFVIVAAIAGFAMSLGARKRIATLELQVKGLQRGLALLQQAPRAGIGQGAAEAAEKPRDVEIAQEAAPEPPAADIPNAGLSRGDDQMPVPAEMARAAGEPVPGPVVKAGRDLETMLGTRWTVWIGALALALGGIFLVRYSIEQGFFGPAARIISGLAFSVLLVVLGEYLRRRAPRLAIEAFERAPVPALLTAVATMSAFGAVFAAHALYDLVSPGVAFIALAITAFGAMLAAGLHGPWLAGLGLLGAMATPALINSPDPDPFALVIYLVLVAAAGYGAASLRGWAQIGRATLGGILIWGLILGLGGVSDGGPLRFYLLAQLVLTTATFAFRPYRSVRDEAAEPALEAHLALALLSALAAFLIAAILRFEAWSGVAMAALLLASAWRLPVVAGAGLMAGLIATALLIGWPALPAPEGAREAAILAMPLPERITAFALVAAGLAGLIGGVSAARLDRGAMLPWRSAGLLALAGVLVPLVLLVLAWLRIRNFGLAPEFGAIAGLLAVAFAGLALRFRREAGLAHAIGVEAFAAGAVAALALGLTMALDRGYLTVSLALAALGAAWVTRNGPVNALRVSAGVLAAIVLGRITWDPAIMAGDPGATPIFNWLLFGYGVPAIAFGLAARLLAPGGEDIPLRLMQGVWVLFAALLAGFEIRHLIHGQDLLTARTSHLELGLHLATSAAIAALLMRLDALDRNPVFRLGSLGFAALTLPIAVFGLFLAKNPLAPGEAVLGGAILNSLIPGYALPALLLVVLYRIARPRRPRGFTRAVAGLGLALFFAYASLATRRLFHGADISLARNETGESELWAYSAIWLALGIAMLAGGILRGSRLMRQLSAAFILPSIAKVFLIDMSGLEGAWRALSFIGLGAALIGIGLVYQRFVFRPMRGGEGGGPSPIIPPGAG